MGAPAIDEESFNALNVLSGELGALNDSIPKLIEAVNQLTQLLSGKTGIFNLLLGEHAKKESEGQPVPIPKIAPPIVTGDWTEFVRQTKSGKGYLPARPLSEDEKAIVSSHLEEEQGLKLVFFKDGGYGWFKPFPAKGKKKIEGEEA